MKDISAKIRGLLFFVLIFLLIIPLIQNKFKFVHLEPLKGAITQTEKEFFSFKGWFSGEYQLREEKFLNETFGFRNFFVRLNNQIAYDLFNKAKANEVIIGKNNYLYEENYIKAYYGTDFIGVDSITQRMQKLKFIQDTLSKLHKNIIVVFAAGKGSFYPEYFPDKYRIQKSLTNYESYLKLAKELGLTYIDFNKYFVENKYKSKYPLYPQYGIHWSYYGMCLAADSLINYIQKLRHIKMSSLYWDKIEMSFPKESDYDIADGMNLLFKFKCEKMAYPHVFIQPDSANTKPSLLVVADSYYWGIFKIWDLNIFSNSEFWFYNKQVYPESFHNSIMTSQIDIKNEIAKYDVIIIMATEATLPEFGWGFIENTYNMFKGVKNDNSAFLEFQEKVAHTRNLIKADKYWMELIINKSKVNKVSVDSMLTLDAIWQLQHENNK